MSKNKTIVNIGHKEYTLMGDESEEYIHKVALHVDRVMREVMENAVSVSDTMVAMLTAINIADQSIKQQDQIAMLKKELRATKDENAKLKLEKEGKEFKVVNSNRSKAQHERRSK